MPFIKRLFRSNGRFKKSGTLKVNEARSLLLEISHLLGSYRSGIVIVGGWVPGLLFPGMAEKRIGNTDVDLAHDCEIVQEIGYRSILELLLSRGCRQGEKPFIFYRAVKLDGMGFEVEVDIITSEYGGIGKKVVDLNQSWICIHEKLVG